MLRVMMECTSLMSSLSLAMLRCVRVSRYSFFVFEMNVSACTTLAPQLPAPAISFLLDLGVLTLGHSCLGIDICASACDVVTQI